MRHPTYISLIGGQTSPVSRAERSEPYAITFHGVRGSTPCHGDDIVRYGGNTSCVSVDIPGHDPIVFDMGTGLRYFGAEHPADVPFRGTFLLSHLHWDHIQGLPFFTPVLHTEAEIDIYAPEQVDGQDVQGVFADTIRPPLFPIDLALLPGEMRFHDVADGRFELPHRSGDPDDTIQVLARSIPHVGPTLGYRVEWRGTSVVYMSDHQMPHDGSFQATAGALELCRGADLIIHDAQYTPEEFATRSTWGHCTMEYAVWLAAHSGAKRLALFHHDPSHDDDRLDELIGHATACGDAADVEVFGAREGLTVTI